MALDKITKQSLSVASIAIVLDFLFHKFFTLPMETWNYFGIKFVVAFAVANYGLSKRLTPFRTSLYFASLFGIFYQALAIFDLKRIIAVSADIHIFGQVINASQFPWSILFGIVHGGALYIGIWLTKRFYK